MFYVQRHDSVTGLNSRPSKLSETRQWSSHLPSSDQVGEHQAKITRDSHRVFVHAGQSSLHFVQVENRDREIERLHRVLDGGRSVDTLSLESRLKSNEKVIAHQNAQVNR